MNGITPSRIISICQNNIDEINMLKSKISELTTQLIHNDNNANIISRLDDFERENGKIQADINYLSIKIDNIDRVYVTRPELDVFIESLNEKFDYEISNQKEEDNIFLKNLE